MVLENKYKSQLIFIIRKHVPNAKIYLFGSRATGKQQPGSDIDIAIDSGLPVPRKKILAILIDIDETTIPVKVDVVDVQQAPDYLKQSILCEGIEWTD